MLESPPPRPPPIRANCFAGWPAWELDLGLAVLFTLDPATGPGSPPVQSLPDSPSLERHLIFHPREAHVLLKALGCHGGAAVVCFRGVSYPGAPLVPRSNNLLQSVTGPWRVDGTRRGGSHLWSWGQWAEHLGWVPHMVAAVAGCHLRVASPRDTVAWVLEGSLGEPREDTGEGPEESSPQRLSYSPQTVRTGQLGNRSTLKETAL